MAKTKSTKHNVTLTFDNKEAAHAFFAYWLDGGGQPDGLNLNATEWDMKNFTFMIIEGDGENEYDN